MKNPFGVGITSYCVTFRLIGLWMWKKGFEFLFLGLWQTGLSFPNSFCSATCKQRLECGRSSFFICRALVVQTWSECVWCWANNGTSSTTYHLSHPSVCFFSGLNINIMGLVVMAHFTRLPMICILFLQNRFLVADCHPVTSSQLPMLSHFFAVGWPHRTDKSKENLV